MHRPGPRRLSAPALPFAPPQARGLRTPALTALLAALGLLVAGCGPEWGSAPPGNRSDDDDVSLGDDDDTGDDDDDTGDDDDATNPDATDTDGDTISDIDEGGSLDFDGDGDGNSTDLDSDDDGIPDAVEAGDADVNTAPVDTDNDGDPDFLDLDSDGNGVLDADEGTGDLDGDGIGDWQDLDNDGDSILDSVEVGDGAEPVDSDGDGTPDYLDDDSDGDGISDALEGSDDPDGDGIPSYLDDDSDGDGASDTSEAGDDPTNPPDSDGDGFYDFEDADSDNDGILDPDEATYGTDIADRDTDGDGFTDLAEVVAGTDPTDPSSVIDGFYAELAPREPTTIDVPFTPEILQADVMFLLDTTCSMTEVLADVAGNFSDVAAQVTIPDIAFGVAEFDDYVWEDAEGVPLGRSDWGDLPFRLRQQVTTDTGAVQSALSSLAIRDGGDPPESALEAIYQVATGRGFDQNGNNAFDSLTDVPPFEPAPTDAFGGVVAGVNIPATTNTGSIGGVGFREGSVPIIVYGTDTWLRDGDDASYSMPPSAGDPVGMSDVLTAVDDISAKIIAVGTTVIPIPQMNNLANATDSRADLDGNGVPEPLVFYGLGNQTVQNVIAGVEALANSGTFDLELVVDDPNGFVTDISPTTFTDVQVNTTVTFTLTVYPNVPQTTSDQAFVFPVQVLGDGAAVLAEWQLVLVVLAG